MVSLTTVPVLLLTLVAVNNTRGSVEAQIADANTTRVRWAGQYLEEVLRRFDDLFYTLQIDPVFLALLDAAEADQPIQRDLVRLMTTSYYSYSGMVDRLIVYIHGAGRAWELDNVASGRVTTPDLDSPIWRGVLAEPIPLSIRPFEDELYAIHTINRFRDQSFRGAMVVRIEETFRETVMEILASAGDGSVYLLNDSFEVLAASPGAADPSPLVERISRSASVAMSPVVERTETELIFHQSVRRGRLLVIKTIPLAMMTASAATTVAAGLVTSAVLVAISLILSIVFALRITRPIVQLAESMREATVPAFVDRRGTDRDEIRQLEEGYQALIGRVKALVEKEFRQEMELKDARLLSLQAQINPHFLNNTLNLLGGMAVANGAPKIYEISRAIGDMFRYAASADHDLVPMSQELSHIRNYLFIQEQRFTGRCTTSLEVDVGVRNTLIPRFTLQPLVENAFEHGLQGKRGRWSVAIRGQRQRAGTIIIVEDDGVGMTPDALAALRSRLRSTERAAGGSASIGLRNVDARLRIHFGDRYGIRVFSSLGRGTRIVVVLPNNAVTSEV